MKLTLKTIIDIINVAAERSSAKVSKDMLCGYRKKGPVPFLVPFLRAIAKVVIARRVGANLFARLATISLFLITSVPIILHEFRKKVNAMLNKTEVRVGAAK